MIFQCKRKPNVELSGPVGFIVVSRIIGGLIRVSLSAQNRETCMNECRATFIFNEEMLKLDKIFLFKCFQDLNSSNVNLVSNLRFVL